MSLTLAIGKRMRFAPGVEGDLKRLGQVLDRYNVPAKAHAAEDHHLRLQRPPQSAGAQRDESRERHGIGRARVVEFHDVKVEVVIAALDRRTHPASIRPEIVEADLDRLLGCGVRTQAQTSSARRCRQ